MYPTVPTGNAQLLRTINLFGNKKVIGCSSTERSEQLTERRTHCTERR